MLVEQGFKSEPLWEETSAPFSAFPIPKSQQALARPPAYSKTPWEQNVEDSFSSAKNHGGCLT